MKAALETFDFLMDASNSLSEEEIKVLKDNLRNCPREMDTNVVIACELVAPLLGPQGMVLNSHHAASSELYVLKEQSK